MELEDSRQETDRPSEIYIDPKDIEAFGSKSGSDYCGESYYHLPSVKPSYYGWRIGAGFFSIGLAGASQILATVIDLTGEEEDRSLVRAGRYIALAGSLVTSAIYIMDLHTPDRWYNMMRIFRKTSWMSIGSWSLATFGALSGITALGQLFEDAGLRGLGKWIARIFEVPASAAGGMLCLYSGAELEATSLPVWERSFPLLPALFVADNASSAASAMLLVTRNSEISDGIWKRLETFSLLTGAVEEIVYRLVSRQWEKSCQVGSPSPDSSIPRPVSFVQRIGMIASLLARMAGMMKRRPPQETSFLSPLLTLGSGFLLPVQVILSGNKSGRRPEEYLCDTQPSDFLNGGARKGNGRKQRIKWRESPVTPFLGLGLFVLGAVAIFISRK